MKVRSTAEVLIRSGMRNVFQAFVEPKFLCRFWLNAANAPLKNGARVEWEFMVPGVRDTVQVTRFERDIGFSRQGYRRPGHRQYRRLRVRALRPEGAA